MRWRMIKFLVHQMAAQRDILKIGDLADQAGLHRVTVSKLWNNKASQVDIRTMDALCVALGCQPGDLMEHVANKPRPKKK